MSWDAKQRGGRYYYRSVRIRDGDGDRVRKEYLGRGAKAVKAAREVERRRNDLGAQRLARQAELLRAAETDRVIEDVHGWVDLLVRATLLVHGWHDHKGEWRRRRHVCNTNGDGSTNDEASGEAVPAANEAEGQVASKIPQRSGEADARAGAKEGALVVPVDDSIGAIAVAVENRSDFAACR